MVYIVWLTDSTCCLFGGVCPRNVPELFSMERGKLASRFSNVVLRDDVVAFEYRARTVPADRHSNAFRNPGAHEIAYAATPQVVKDCARIDHFGFRLRPQSPRFRDDYLTSRSVDYGLY